MRSPERIVAGHSGLLVAQTRLLGGLLRVPFFDVEGTRVMVTMYWTSQTLRYWEE